MKAERQSKWQPILFGAVGIIALVLVGLLVKNLIGHGSGAVKKPPKISLMPTTQPPPPPPPKEEKRPEPPKEQKEVKMEQVEQKIEQPDNPVLKMEGAAGDGPSAFAAGTVKNDYIGQTTGGGGRMLHGLFVDRLQRHLQEQLNRNRKLRQTDYRVTLSIWIAPDGTVQRAELGQTTGNTAVDDLLKQTLLQIAAMREAPPENMPQPIRVRVTARGAG